jgi:muramoyltetrapeptide carboxypeptidase
MAGKLSEIRGLVFGTFTRCDDDGERGVSEIIAELFDRVPYPVMAGFPAGHGEENLLLPFGAKMVLDADAGFVTLIEQPVEL